MPPHSSYRVPCSLYMTIRNDASVREADRESIPLLDFKPSPAAVEDMQLANSKAKLADCPYVTEEAKAKLEASSAPPIRLVSIGAGESKFEIGDETELYRHDKKFFHQTRYAIVISDTASDKEAGAKLKRAADLRFERVGQNLAMDMLGVRNDSGDPAKFASMVARVAKESALPLVLMSADAEAIKAAASAARPSRPLIYAADANNWQAMAAVAKELKFPLAVKHDELNGLAGLVEKVRAAGVEDLVLDLCPRDLQQLVERNTIVRKNAVKKTFRGLGFPIVTNACGSKQAVLMGVALVESLPQNDRGALGADRGMPVEGGALDHEAVLVAAGGHVLGEHTLQHAPGGGAQRGHMRSRGPRPDGHHQGGPGVAEREAVLRRLPEGLTPKRVGLDLGSPVSGPSSGIDIKFNKAKEMADDEQKDDKTYSHSRLSCYEQCPRRYQYRYVDQVEVEEMQGIEAFTGTMVHLSLQHLHEEAAQGRVLTATELIVHFESLWKEHYDCACVKVVKRGTTCSDYRMGARVGLQAYYRRYQPFDDGEMVGMEHEVRFTVGKDHRFVGYIDM